MENLHFFGAAIGLGMIVIGAALGIGRFAAAAAEGIARQPNAAAQIAPARAICNQARPVLASEVRMIDSDGLLMKRVPAAAGRPASISTRTALEIVVTPQL